jgi:hypothetical protein
MKPLIAPLLVLLALAAVSAGSVPVRRRTREVDKNGNRHLASIFGGELSFIAFAAVLCNMYKQQHFQFLFNLSTRMHADNGTGNLQGYAYEWHSPNIGMSNAFVLSLSLSLELDALLVRELQLCLCCETQKPTLATFSCSTAVLCVTRHNLQ